VAQEFSLTAVGVLMTGMGDDGAGGLGAIKAAGGMTIAQSEESCVVSGMPRSAIVKGYANRIVSLDGMAAYLLSQYHPDRSSLDKKEKDKLEKTETAPVSSLRN
jgi:two-component system chemotaxis response regulator CheB